jgi:hypothetical protein
MSKIWYWNIKKKKGGYSMKVEPEFKRTFKRFFFLFFIFGLGVPKVFAHLCGDAYIKEGNTLYSENFKSAIPLAGIPVLIWSGYQKYQMTKLAKLINEAYDNNSSSPKPITKGLLKSLSRIDPGNKILTPDELKKTILKMSDTNNLGKETEDYFCLYWVGPYKLYVSHVNSNLHYRSFKSRLKDMISLKKSLDQGKKDYGYLDKQDGE